VLVASTGPILVSALRSRSSFRWPSCLP
jgi:hypothetical protein